MNQANKFITDWRYLKEKVNSLNELEKGQGEKLVNEILKFFLHIDKAYRDPERPVRLYSYGTLEKKEEV